jgi:O-antigen/teichoic acid export membrane protein
MLMLPAITRLYDPASFATLAVYSSIVAVLSIAACLRFELAIPLPLKDLDAAKVLFLALVSCATTSGLVGLLVWLIGDDVMRALGQPELAKHRWLIPFGVILTAGSSAAQFWLIRCKSFAEIARARVGQSLASATVQFAGGVSGYGVFALLFGQSLSSGAGLLSLLRQLRKTPGLSLSAMRFSHMAAMFKRYDRFPKFSTLEALFNTAAMQVPLVAIAWMAPGPEAGYVMLASRVSAIPMGLIGNSIGQVFLSRAPEEYRAGTLDTFIVSMFGGLLKSGGGPLAFIGILAPSIFPLVFGPQWPRAGVLVAWMTPWFIMQFLCGPISMSLHVTHNQRVAMVLQFFGLALRLGSVMLVGILASGLISEAYALSGFLFYSIYLLVILSLTGVKRKNLRDEIKRNGKYLIAWILAALCVVGFLLFTQVKP